MDQVLTFSRAIFQESWVNVVKLMWAPSVTMLSRVVVCCLLVFFIILSFFFFWGGGGRVSKSVRDVSL